MSTVILNGVNSTYTFNPEDLGSIIGKGGMGCVYKGIDQNNRPVAIKVMHEAISAYVNNVEQAKREAAIKIKHKHLIQMLDFIENTGGYYIVSEYIDGETLRSKMAKSPQGFDQQMCIDILTNILEGLAMLHSFQVIHRDIDPSNVMICKDGSAKLMDFGIAKISGYDLQTLTGTGAFKGKLHYAAPEQIKGEKININYTTDIYAVGITMYEMLTGILPFNGESEFDLMNKHIQDPLPKNSKIPNNLFGLIVKATAKNQNERFKSAAEFLEALGHEKPLKTAKEYYERAEKYKKEKNWKKAIENYEIAIEKNNNCPDGYFNRAYCFAQIGQHQNAINNYNTLIKYWTAGSEAYLNRAISFSEIGKINEAIADYKQAILISPGNESYVSRYISFLESNNMHQQLIDEINEKIKLDPNNSDLYLQRAFANFDLGKKEEFKEDLQNAKRSDSKEAQFILIDIPRIICLNWMVFIILIVSIAFYFINLFAFFSDHPLFSEGDTVLITLLFPMIFLTIFMIKLSRGDLSGDSSRSFNMKLGRINTTVLKTCNNQRIQTKISRYLAKKNENSISRINDKIILVIGILTIIVLVSYLFYSLTVTKFESLKKIVGYLT